MRRVLIVDDSSLMRRILSSVIDGLQGYAVQAMVGSAEEADRHIAQNRPDLVILDVHLPGMDGLTYLKRLRQHCTAPVIVISGRSLAGQSPSALDRVRFVAKPDGCERTLDDFRRELGTCLRLWEGGAPGQNAAGQQAGRPGSDGRRPRLIAIGGSTGGVDALTTLLAALRQPLPPILAVLHMPAAYTTRFAQRLGTVTGHATAEARDGERLQPGTVRLAPGDRHLRIERCSGQLVTRLSDSPPVSGHRPSVDVLFHSVAQGGERAAGVILTGMGRDGADGLLAMRRAGALTFGQSGASCTVYGMPKVAREIGAVGRELGLAEIAGELMRC